MKRITRFSMLLVALVWTGSGSATAQNLGRENRSMVALVEPLAQQAHGRVVQVLCDGRPVSLGTVVAADGYVLTKRSEISGGDPIRVRLADDRLYPARVAAMRRANDLALLHVDIDEPLKPLEFTDEIPVIANFLVTPDRTGRPIGIGVVGTRPRAVADQGRLGVQLKQDFQGRALVSDVEPRSGAQRAGIRPGDLILGINGRNDQSQYSVRESLLELFPGDDVRLTILRPSDSQEMETLEMKARIMEYALMMESDSDVRVNGPRNARLSGFDQVIQHDTVLDVDECGGPILDTHGRAVGINIARAGRVVSYAIPSSLVKSELTGMLSKARRGE